MGSDSDVNDPQSNGVEYFDVFSYSVECNFPNLKKITVLDGISELTLGSSVKAEEVVILGHVNEVSIQECPNLTSVLINGSVGKIECSNNEQLTNVFVRSLTGNTGLLENTFRRNAKLESVVIQEMTADTIQLDSTFVNCEALTELYLPKPITVLGDSSFAGCKVLSDLPDLSDVEVIGNYVFSGCDQVQEISLPNLKNSANNPEQKEEISLESMFSGCSNLEKVTIGGEKIQRIRLKGSNFYGCANLIEVNTDADIVEVGHDEFYNCSSLQHLPSLSECSGVGYSAFQGCSKLESIDLKGGVIEGHAFYDCTSLTSVEMMEEGVVLSRSAFSGCSALEQVIIGNLLNSQMREHRSSQGIFSNCTSLQRVIICQMEEPLYAGERMFEGCAKLTELKLPLGIGKIGEGSFSGCSSLTELPMLTDTVEINPSKTFENCSALKEVIIPTNAVVYSATSYKMFLNCTSLEKVVFPDGITIVGESTFEGCSSLKELTISAQTTEIASNAFKDCEKLSALELPDCVTKIASLPSGLEIFRIPAQCKTTLDNLFYYVRTPGFPNLKKLTVPGSYQKVVGLNKLTALEEVVLEEGITDFSFSRLSSLKKVQLPEGITSIPNQAFYNCTSLEELNVPSTVTEIGASAFRGCEKLPEIVLPEGVTSLGIYCFENCTALTYVSLPDSLETIPQFCFYQCGLTNVDFPSNLKTIDYAAFAECNALNNIDLPETITALNARAFENTALQSVTITADDLTVAGDVFNTADILQFSVKHLSLVSGGALQKASKVTFNTEELALAKNALSMAAGNAAVYFLKGSVTFVESTSKNDYSISQTSGSDNSLSLFFTSAVTSISGNAIASNEKAVTIYGTTGSVAESYARENGYTFKNYILWRNRGEGEEDGSVLDELYQFRYHQVDNGVEVVEYLGVDTEVQVPETLGSYDVVSIAANAFDKYQIKSISLPKTLEHIDIDFAEGCRTVQRDSKTGVMGSLAIQLGSINVDEGNPYFSSWDGILYNHDETEVLLAPPALKGEVNLPGSVVKIGDRAFRNCKNNTIRLNEFIESIGEEAFKYSNIETAYIGSRVTYIGDNAFQGSKIESAVWVSPLTEIPNGMFYGCTKLTGFDIPTYIQSIGEKAFAETALNMINIPTNVSFIGDEAFARCKKAAYVTVGGSIASIGEDIFRDTRTEYYTIAGSQMEQYINDHVMKGYLFTKLGYGVEVGDYVIGIDIVKNDSTSDDQMYRMSDGTNAKSWRVQPDDYEFLPRNGLSNYEITLTRPVLYKNVVLADGNTGRKNMVELAEDAKIYAVDASTDKKIAFIRAANITLKEKEEKDVLAVESSWSSPLRANTKIYLEFEGKVLKFQGAMNEESWSTKGLWEKRTFPDWWGSTNPSGENGEISQGLYTTLYGAVEGPYLKAVKKKGSDGSGGICGGMASSALAVLQGRLLPGVDMYTADENAGILDSITTKELWQIAYLLNTETGQTNVHEETLNDYDDFLDYTKRLKDEGELFLIDLNLKEGLHNVMAYHVAEVSENQWDVYVYDCNRPNGNNVLSLFIRDGEIADWYYPNRQYGVKAIHRTDLLRTNFKNKEYLCCYYLSDEFMEKLQSYIKRRTVMKNVSLLIMSLSAESSDEYQIVSDYSVIMDKKVENENNGDSRTMFFWVDSATPVELENIPANGQVTLISDASMIEVTASRRANMTLQAAETAQKQSRADIRLSGNGTFHVEISNGANWSDTAIKDYASVMTLDGDAKRGRQVTISDTENGIILNGAEKVAVKAEKDGKSSEASYENLTKYPNITVEVNLQEEDERRQLTAQVDVDGDGTLDQTVPQAGESSTSGGDTNPDTPDPGTGGNTPDPGTGGNTPDPGTGGNTPDPGTGGNTPDPGTGGNTPDPGTGGNTPDPGTGGNMTDPGEGENAKTPGAVVTPPATSQKTEADKPLPAPISNLTLPANSLVMQTKQSTKKFIASGIAVGDRLKSVVSSKPSVVKVSGVEANGSVKLTAGKKPGSAKVTFTLASGQTKTVKIKVQKGKVATKSIKGIKKKLSMKKGQTIKLTAVISPVTSQDTVTYTSSNSKVASVSKKGVVTAKKAGTAKIIVKAGKKKVTCVIKVK